MARIPPDASPAVQEAFRLLWAELEKSKALVTDFSRRRLSNIGDPTQPFDAATKDYVDAQSRTVTTSSSRPTAGVSTRRIRIDEFTY